MGDIKSGKELILQAFEEKSSLKQDIYYLTLEIFSEFKKVLKRLQDELIPEIHKMDSRLSFVYNEEGDFRAEIKFAGDILIFSVHSNVFNFDDTHSIYKKKYVREDHTRTYCGMIQIHNFLADSFRYERQNDIGYLIARVFFNKEKHFFVEGKRQLGFLYNDFENSVINEVYIQSIIESAILYAIDFDLLVPPYKTASQITVKEMNTMTGITGISTGKRLGFQFSYEQDED